MPRRLDMNRGRGRGVTRGGTRGGTRGRGRAKAVALSTKSVAGFYAKTAQLDKKQRAEKVKQATLTYNTLMGKLLKQQKAEHVVIID